MPTFAGRVPVRGWQWCEAGVPDWVAVLAQPLRNIQDHEFGGEYGLLLKLRCRNTAGSPVLRALWHGFGGTASTGSGAILGVVVALAAVPGGILLRPAPLRA